ncbi:unnamed protein product [Arctogadus glacialis]
MNAQDCREKSREPNIEKEAGISMFKFMLVIVVLMQSCRGDDQEWRSLRVELMSSIEALQTELGRELGNWSFTGYISLPSNKMRIRAFDCRGVFAKALNTTWHQLKSNSTEIDNLLTNLKANTELLPQPQTNRTCPMDVKKFNPSNSFGRLDTFLRTLNE